MALDKVSNFAKTTITGITSGTTEVVLDDATNFLDPASGEYNCVIWEISNYGNPADDPNKEIVRAVSLSGSTLGITRAQESTSDVDHNTGGETYAIANVLTSKMITDIDNELSGKQATLGFTPEDVANKKTDLTDNSDTYYPTQKAVKTAVDEKAPLISPSFTTPTLGVATGTSLDLEGTTLKMLSLKNTDANSYTRMLFDGTGVDFAQGVGNSSAAITDLRDKFYIYDFTNSKTAFTIVPNTLAAKLYGSLEVVGGLTGTVTLPKTIEIQDTSADHTYNLAVSELTADRTITLPLLTGDDEFVFKDHTQTLTKKRINPRLVTATSYTTNTGTSLDVSTCDQFEITAQAGDLKFNNPSGTPLGGQKLVIRIKDDGTARALTYDTYFRAVGVELPATTVISKTLYMGFIYNATDTKWDLLAVANEA